MGRRLALVLLVVVAAGCRPDSGLDPTPGQPTLTIQDGSSGGNPEFFFLPPIKSNPAKGRYFSPGTFNPNLAPVVEICALAASSVQNVTRTTPCQAPGQTPGFPVSFSRDGTATGVRVVDGEQYLVNWRMPVAPGIFRITVRVGSTVLGFADATPKGTNTGVDGFIGVVPGQVLGIRFRIENRALCTEPLGTGPCGSKTIDLAAGGIVSVSTDPLLGPSGVSVPPQGGPPRPVTVTVQTCPDFNPRAIDLPTFGTCLTITTDPLVTQALTVPATVFVCDYPPDVSGLDHEQQELVSLHRLEPGSPVQALPHATFACIPPATSAMIHLREALRRLEQGRWRSGVSELFALLGPTPLVALDRGGGGLTIKFSDFQFALPAKMVIVAGDGQTGAPGSTLPVDPTVLVTDLEDRPVVGATVRFAGSGTVSTPAVLTDAGGLARVSWTLGTAPNTLTASGRGIAGGNVDGPRSIFDPFQALEAAFNPAGDPVPDPPVPADLATGTRVFSATTVVLPYGSAGYRYQVETAETPPPGWQLPGFDDSSFLLGQAPFGSQDEAGCPLTPRVTTIWPIQSTILTRRAFSLGSPATLRIAIAIDNDVRVFLDGVDVSGGLRTFEGCATLDRLVLTVPAVGAGPHVLAILAVDRGTSSYLDAEIQLVP